MNPLNQPDLDVVIQRALSAEPLRSVPAGFDTRLIERARIAVAVKEERRHSRFRAAALVTLGIASVYVFFITPYLTVSRGWVEFRSPGVLGNLKPMVAFVIQHWTAISIGAGLLAGVGGAAVVAAGIAVSLHRGRAHGVKLT